MSLRSWTASLMPSASPIRRRTRRPVDPRSGSPGDLARPAAAEQGAAEVAPRQQERPTTRRGGVERTQAGADDPRLVVAPAARVLHPGCGAGTRLAAERAPAIALDSHPPRTPQEGERPGARRRSREIEVERDLAAAAQVDPPGRMKEGRSSARRSHLAAARSRPARCERPPKATRPRIYNPRDERPRHLPARATRQRADPRLRARLAEREALKSRLGDAPRTARHPLVIGGEEVRTGDTFEAVEPHNQGERPCRRAQGRPRRKSSARSKPPARPGRTGTAGPGRIEPRSSCAPPSSWPDRGARPSTPRRCSTSRRRRTRPRSTPRSS